MSKGLEELRKLCGECESHLAINKKYCPFRSISNEYCDEYENVKKELCKPQQLYNYIKQKEYNAEIDYEKERKREKSDILILNELQGEIKTYHDVLCLMESMFEVEENE